MLRISQLKLPVTHTEEDLKKKIVHTLMCRTEAVQSYEIIKQSLDARKKPELFYVYTVDVKADNEKQLLKMLTRKKRAGNVQLHEAMPYVFPAGGNEKLKSRPVVVGCGPAGLFCAYFLAEYGYQPVLLEQGAPVEERQKDVEEFWKTGVLKPDSNVQFGEGGAGTFSDGKLNTLVKDPVGRNRKVLELFVEAGADEEILYEQKPHLGTDELIGIVTYIRKEIERLGGEVRFHCQMTDLLIQNGQIHGVQATDLKTGEMEEIVSRQVVLAVGHSARDTFSMLKTRQIPMRAKPFAVGVRMEHPQEMINISQYGADYPSFLPSAAYKVTRQTGAGRGVYSFRMCPGGYVVNASSEKGHLAVNGMSYHARDSRNANSAMIVTVTPEDFGSDDILAGVEFQRKLERAAYELGGGKVPVQLFGDFCQNIPTTTLGEVEPCIKGQYTFANVRNIFPAELSSALEEGIHGCEKLIRGFDRPDAVLSGVESRTSSPVRIMRDETFESEIRGLYPCGEGAGYAGGITSAAMDGLKIAEAIAKKYLPCYD